MYRGDEKLSRQSPFTPMLDAALDKALRQAMFCLPGRIVAFDPVTQLAQVECGIQQLSDGEFETIAVIESVPVQFSGDNGWYFWHKITPGQTTGLIHFSQRAVDTWIEQGGPVAPHELRLLSVDDGFFAPGYRTKPGAIPNFINDGIGLSNYAATTKIHLTNSGVEVSHAGENLEVVLDDLSGVIDGTLSQLSSETVTITSGSSAGTWPVGGQSVYADLLTDLQAVRARINTLLDAGSP